MNFSGLIRPPQARLDAVLSEVIDRRAAGEALSDEEVMLAHPELMPALANSLAELQEIEQAVSGAAAPHRKRWPAIAGYEITAEISAGAQGVVYLANRSADQRQVALKILHAARAADPVQRDRLKAEADVLSDLRHPNIVSFIECGTLVDRRTFLVMEYIAGEPLDPAKLASRMSLEERLGLFVVICQAVSAAHSKGIVHRDLKPSNIRLGTGDVPYVLDFGLARSPQGALARETMTATGEFLGSYLWASPEQHRAADSITPASDVYSLGVILHQLVTRGSLPPHVFVSMLATLGPHMSPAKVKRVERQLLTLSDARLRAIIDRCLHVDPKSRYADAGELVSVVASDLMQPRVTRWRLRRWIAGLGVLAALSVAAFLVFATRQAPAAAIVNGRPLLAYGGIYRMVWIPPGQATLGSADDAMFRLPDERLHSVTFKTGFYMSESEVTCFAYRTVMGEPSATNDEDQLPKTDVSWFEAMEFCRRLSLKEGRHYRLPKEDEWEYAARAGETTPYPNWIRLLPDDADCRLMPRYANSADASSGFANADRRYSDSFPGITHVNRLLPNEWRLFDMLGNVWEWTGELYRTDLSEPATASSTRPTSVSTRGGSFTDTWRTFRFSGRNPLPPDFKSGNVGFRIVCDGP